MLRRGHLLIPITVLLVGGLLLSTTRRDAAAFAYLQNGSFESGADSWRAGNADLVIVDGTEVPPVDGSKSARLTFSASTFLISQTLFDVPPGTYTVSAFVRRSLPGTTIYLRAQVTNPEANGLPETIEPSGVAGEWLSLSGQLSVLSFAQVQVAIGGSGSGSIYIDAVRFDGAPPTTATPSLTATPTPIASAIPTSTGTRTGTPTRTPAQTPAPTESPLAALGVSLDNDGFERADGDGSPAGWYRYGGDLSLVSQPVHSGEHAARFESTTDSTKWLYQPLAVVAGATYAFSAWIASDDPAVAYTTLRISWYESADSSGGAIATSDATSRLDAPSAGYRYLTTGATTAPQDARSARLRVLLSPVSGAPAVIYVDDASFAPADPAEVLTSPIPVTSAGEEPTSADGPPVRAVLGAAKRPARQGAAGDGTMAPLGRLTINEVLYDPDSGKGDADGEWVELFNSGTEPADLTGWSIADAASSDQLPALRIEAHGFAVIAASDSFRTTYPGFAGTFVSVSGHIGNSLGNDGDSLTLRDPSGATIDAVSWGSDTSALAPSVPDVPAGHSIERRSPGLDTNAAADFIDNESPSPGGPIASPAAKSHPENGPPATADITPTANTSVGRWLPWALASAAAFALLLTLAWRLLPVVTQRFRTHP